MMFHDDNQVTHLNIQNHCQSRFVCVPSRVHFDWSRQICNLLGRQEGGKQGDNMGVLIFQFGQEFVE